MKVFWLTLQPFFYAFRPTIVRPKSFGKWELINFLVCIAFDLLVLQLLGIKALAYFVLGTLLGLGLHPAAAHLIAEHYETVSGQETYSYYGPANYLNFNVGYHNEHHDFPRIPWSRLPELTRIAPEFYLSLPYYTSYLAVLWAYITDNDLGPHARIKRANKEKEKAMQRAARQRRRQGRPAAAHQRPQALEEARAHPSSGSASSLPGPWPSSATPRTTSTRSEAAEAERKEGVGAARQRAALAC